MPCAAIQNPSSALRKEPHFPPIIALHQNCFGDCVGCIQEWNNGHPHYPRRQVIKIYCGPACTSFAIANNGTAYARTTGLYLAANAAALSAQLLEASVRQGARGLCVSIEGVAFALPPMTPQHYAYVPAALRSIPVALVVTTEQATFLEGIAQTAASAGTIRRTFLSRAEADEWVLEQTRALAANRAWWSWRHLPP
jgi:hypothetical protein